MKHGMFGVFFLICSSAMAQEADVGVVSQLTGDVTFSSTDGVKGKVNNFMRVRANDRFAAAAGGQITVVYFSSARQEKWTGPVSFRVTRQAGVPISGNTVEVSTLPVGTQQRFARLPELMNQARAHLGGVQIRGGIAKSGTNPKEQETLRAAREIYAQMRKDASADDITPDLFMYVALAEFFRFPEMKQVVGDMLKKQPGNADIKVLDDWVSARLAEK